MLSGCCCFLGRSSCLLLFPTRFWMLVVNSWRLARISGFDFPQSHQCDLVSLEHTADSFCFCWLATDAAAVPLNSAWVV